MHPRLRPAFVITLAALAPACTKKSGSDGAGSVTVPTSSAIADDTGGAPPPPPATRKRVVRSPLPSATPSPPLGPNMRDLNPRLEGRFVYAAASGHCLVMMPPPPGTPPPPPGAESGVAKNVDCPDAMMDPAWDTCLHGTLMTDGTRCSCFYSGNPPPPPMTAECPTSVDAAP